MSTNFNLPTLVSITAPTCAGKNYLLEGLISELGFNRIVGTTDRAPRAGEVQGLHYDFLTTEQSKRVEAQGDFAEIITYNGVRYGVTHREMEYKMQLDGPPVVILEPTGLQKYREYCASKKWQMFTIYVNTQEDVRIARLGARTADDIFIECSLAQGRMPHEVILKHVQRNNNRLRAVLNQECYWQTTNRWDVYVSGTDLEKDLADVRHAVESRNKRKDIYA